MMNFAAYVVDQGEAHWTLVPIALAAEIPETGVVLQLVVYLQAPTSYYIY